METFALIGVGLVIFCVWVVLVQVLTPIARWLIDHLTR